MNLNFLARAVFPFFFFVIFSMKHECIGICQSSVRFDMTDICETHDLFWSDYEQCHWDISEGIVNGHVAVVAEIVMPILLVL